MEETSRRRSVVWSFFKITDCESVQCLLCSSFLQKNMNGSTTSMLRHLRVKHPTLVRNGQVSETTTSSDMQDMDVDEEQQFCSVEVVLEDGDSDVTAPVNEADMTSADINGLLDVSQDGPAEQMTRSEADDDRPVLRTQHKRSLIWRYFELLDSLNAARCRICKKKLQYSYGGTSNLRRHLSKRHPKVFSALVANGQQTPTLNPSQDSKTNGDTDETFRMTEQRRLPGALKVSGASEGERRVFRRERELIEALRRAQKEEARALEHQRELLERLRAADAREAAAEREKIESLRKAQQEEANELSRQREELQKEKAELHKKWEELQQEREGLLLLSRGQ
ncbi:zinc finger BED domain-containing protein isoform X2 [Acanthochromis polyacanthus]|uniref:Stress response protein NST1-like n=1 Tax=Acanthochromis polyacanthus TaxID=80966 RepID=A0A3Q1F1C1_9TELE|nr:zinc finger BED domain-containing protein isoform X2 [Acanthochromis polyacanthus]